MPWGQPVAVACAGFQVRGEGPGGGGHGGAIALQFLQRHCDTCTSSIQVFKSTERGLAAAAVPQPRCPLLLQEP